MPIAVGLLVLVLVVAEIVLRYRDVMDGPAFEENPDYSYLMRRSQSVSTRGIRFSINNQGLRGRDFTESKSPGEVRIGFVGCSVTYGGGYVRDDELFVDHVATILSKAHGRRYEAINLSAPGWGIRNMTSFLRTRGAYGAGILVWVLSSADFRRPKTTLAEYGFWKRKSPSRVVYFLVGVLFALTSASRYRRSRALEAPRSGPELLEDNVTALEACLRQMGQAGVRQMIAVIPMASENAERLEDARRFEALAAGLAIPFVALKPLLDQAGADAFVDHCHLSARGHDVVGRALAGLIG